jgi:hypothetical protein
MVHSRASSLCPPGVQVWEEHSPSLPAVDTPAIGRPCCLLCRHHSRCAEPIHADCWKCHADAMPPGWLGLIVAVTRCSTVTWH